MQVIDIFNNYSPHRLDHSNPFFAQKMRNWEVAKEAYFGGKSELTHLPLRATLQTTERCNLRCPMCKIHGSPIDRQLQSMDEKLLREIVNQLFPTLLEFHPSNIGEPLAHKWFDELCDMAKMHGVMMDLTTNGTLITKERITRILPILLDIKFSWDGATRKTFEAIRVGADYDQVVQNLTQTIEARNRLESQATITLQMTVMKSNYQEIPALIEFAAGKGVDRVKAYHMFSHRQEMDAESMVSELEAFDSIRLQAIALAKQCNVTLEISEPNLATGQPPDLVQQACRLLWTECWIDVDGTIFPCHSHKNLSYGKVGHDDFLSAWNHSRFVELRAAQAFGSPNGICTNCGMNYLKKDENQAVPIDLHNYVTGGNGEAAHRWSSRSKQFEIPRK